MRSHSASRHAPVMSNTDRGRNVPASLLRVICAAQVSTATVEMLLFIRLTSRRDVYASKSPCRRDAMSLLLRSMKYTPVGISVGTCGVKR